MDHLSRLCACEKSADAYNSKNPHKMRNWMRTQFRIRHYRPVPERQMSPLPLMPALLRPPGRSSQLRHAAWPGSRENAPCGQKTKLSCFLTSLPGMDLAGARSRKTDETSFPTPGVT